MKPVHKQQPPPPTIKKSGWRFRSKGGKYPAPREVLGKKSLIEVLSNNMPNNNEAIQAIIESANQVYSIEITIYSNSVGLLVRLRNKQKFYIEVKSIDREIRKLGFNVYFS